MGSPEEALVRATAARWRDARGVLVSGLWSVSQGAHRYPDGVFPLLADHGEGCRLWDSDGRSYVDWIMGWGPVLLGYRHPVVEHAIRQQLSAGPLLSLLHAIEIDTALAIRAMVPCAERVAFAKNGSDVLGAAVRLARAATGREGVLVCGYHGFQDWFMASVPACPGIPAALRQLVRPFAFNDLRGVEALFAEHGEHIAAVVLEPAATELPAPGFLEGLRRLCTRHRSALVFDEVITAFRLARGGAQEAFGVVPDLACLGKGMGNGMPLSALVGRAELMEAVPFLGFGATFRGETLSLAAARACLRIVAETDVTGHLARVGAELRERLARSAAAVGVDVCAVGPFARQTIRFAVAGRLGALGLQTLFVQECCKHGVLTNGNLLPSLAHDAAAIEQTTVAMQAALEVVARAIAADDLQPFLQVPVQPHFLGQARD